MPFAIWSAFEKIRLEPTKDKNMGFFKHKYSHVKYN